MTTLTPEQVDYFMGEAIREAKKAGALGEVPIGAVVVQNGQIIGRGFNLRERLEDASQHAELQAITEANRLVKSWRLPDAQLFVTLEPCIMCAGAIMWSGVKTVYFGVPSSEVERITGFDEGYKPNWISEFKKRGITVYGNIEQANGEKVLEDYVNSGKEIYKPTRD